tara:strand:+ start:121 stop:405 length:285 start_codon:yes stop_codon:yes gene_type:complete
MMLAESEKRNKRMSKKIHSLHENLEKSIGKQMKNISATECLESETETLHSASLEYVHQAKLEYKRQRWRKIKKTIIAGAFALGTIIIIIIAIVA